MKNKMKSSEEPGMETAHGSAKNGGRMSLLDKLRKHLCNASSEDLLEIVMEETKNTKDFRDRLLEKFTAAGMEWDFGELRHTIRAMLRFSGFIEYRQSNAYASKIEQTGMLLKSVMFHGHAFEALSVIESIIPALEKAIGNSDDSNGSIGEQYR